MNEIWYKSESTQNPLGSKMCRKIEHVKSFIHLMDVFQLANRFKQCQTDLRDHHLPYQPKTKKMLKLQRSNIFIYPSPRHCSKWCSFFSQGEICSFPEEYCMMFIPPTGYHPSEFPKISKNKKPGTPSALFFVGNFTPKNQQSSCLKNRAPTAFQEVHLHRPCIFVPFDSRPGDSASPQTSRAFVLARFLTPSTGMGRDTSSFQGATRWAPKSRKMALHFFREDFFRRKDDPGTFVWYMICVTVHHWHVCNW